MGLPSFRTFRSFYRIFSPVVIRFRSSAAPVFGCSRAKAAHAEGRTGGNRRKMSPQDLVIARRHMTDNKLKAREVAKMYSERTLWRNLRWAADVEAIKET